MERTSPRHYLAAALIGIGVAVIGYRVVAFLMNHHETYLWFLPALGGVFVVGGIQLTRSAKGPEANALLTFLAGLAAFATVGLIVGMPQRIPYAIDWAQYDMEATDEWKAPEEPAVEAVEEPAPETNVGELHINFQLPKFNLEDRRSFGVSMATDVSYVSLQEIDAGTTWTESEIKDLAPSLGFALASVKGPLADGRRTFVTSAEDSEPGATGWFATKKCGEREIVFMTASSSKTEQTAILAAWRKARCTDEVKEY